MIDPCERCGQQYTRGGGVIIGNLLACLRCAAEIRQGVPAETLEALRLFEPAPAPIPGQLTF